MPYIQQNFQLIIPANHILEAYLSCPDWDQDQINKSYGYVRDFPRAKDAKEGLPLKVGFDNAEINLNEVRQCLNKPVRLYDQKSRKTYPNHISACRITLDKDKKEAVLAIGNGNLLSNLGIVGYIKGTDSTRFLKTAWEDKRITNGWQYTCFHCSKNPKTGKAGIEKVSFQDGKPTPDLNHDWIASGQPILWNGIVSNPEDLIAETYDFRHIYQLRATVGSHKETKDAYEKIQEYMSFWMDVFQDGNLTQEMAAQKLKREAYRKAFSIECRYLQNALGVDRSGNLYVVQKHGTMRDIAQTLKQMGAERAILLDQGGSVGVFYQSPKYCKEGDFITRSRDLRPTRLCILVFKVIDEWNEA